MSTHCDQARHAPIIVIDEPGRQPLLVVVVQPLEIGRECAGIVLTDPAISRRHLLVVAHGPTVRVTDLSTTNGSTRRRLPARTESPAATPETSFSSGAARWAWRSEGRPT